MMPSSVAAASQHDEPSPQRATFILRLWRERLDDAHADWRGTIEHVQRASAGPDGVLTSVKEWLRVIVE